MRKTQRRLTTVTLFITFGDMFKKILRNRSLNDGIAGGVVVRILFFF